MVRLTLRVVRIRSSSRLILSGPQMRSSNHAAMSPLSTGRHSGVAGDDLVDPLGGRARDPGRALGHEQEHAVVLAGEVGEVDAAVLRVVEARDRRLVARHHHLAEHLEAGLHALQRPAEEDVVLGQVGEELHRHLGDEAEGALVADHDVADVGAGRPARHVLDPRHLAAGEHGLEPDDHVLDPAVERRELADAAGGDEAAHVGDRLRLRGVPRRQPELAGPVLERLQRHAALAGGLHVVGVDAQDPVHPRAVEDDRVRDDGLEAALGRRAAGARDDVDAVALGEREHLRRLLRAARPSPPPPAAAWCRPRRCSRACGSCRCCVPGGPARR